jgi:aldose sugar dehydrogenase
LSWLRRATLAVCLFAAPVAGAGTVETSAGPVTISPVATGLDEPWALGFLPDGSFLVTERDGRLTL